MMLENIYKINFLLLSLRMEPTQAVDILRAEEIITGAEYNYVMD